MSRRAVEFDMLPVPSVAADMADMVTGKTRIVIVSETRFFREALGARLGQNDRLEVIDTVDHFGALRLIASSRPDLVLLDVGEWHGLDRATTLLREQPDLEILAIGVPEIAAPALCAIGRGIAGCVPRDGSIDDVIAQVDRLTAGGRSEQIPSEQISIVAGLEEPPGRIEPVPAARSRLGELTPRECEILQMIEVGLSNKEIARTLRIEVGTVKNHVHNILEKLNVRRRNQAAHRLRAYHQR
ncbi:DNA-binding response regulator [Bradyrhizobium sp. SSBR45G]|uniref:LuxR C-terminal-related transcriptional regulator n=1 Tax=unclassified Bradyrhizobium TaxID=2631580 RepID=UPI002342A121|nr:MULTISPECIES: response regulator transcription factor [unclassified Bradyrhizobium]GLH80795.1 DNA-binding response regulator [Bradyrhizobium sp. SSBR45G]GLH88167.1 DNA-binding response regulator [Bradyrhizobium sp. SSBR45R]